MQFFLCLLSLLFVRSLSVFDVTSCKTTVCFGESITHGGFYPMYRQQDYAEKGPEHPRGGILRGIAAEARCPVC